MRTIILSSLLFVLFMACGQEPEQLKKEIDALEKVLMSASKNVLDKETATTLIEKTQILAEQYPDDPTTPSYLFKAAEVCNGIGKSGLAIKLFAKVHRNYEKHEKAAPALFLQAFTFENFLKDKENAVKFYNEFLVKFPDHQFAKDAKQAIKYIDKSPEELIKQFQKNQQKQ